MTTYVQTKKKLIDVGEVGNANTGDIIYDGGVKLNEALNALYNTFGDVRLWDVNEGVGSQVLHASGYYQKNPYSYYAKSPVDVGSMHDINTIAQTFVVTLPNPKLGECCEFINSNGSWSTNKITFKAQDGADIMGSKTIDVTHGYSRVEFTCIDDTQNSAKWGYRISPMFGDFSVPVNTTIEIDKIAPKSIPLYTKTLYDGVKLMMSAVEVKAGIRERTVSEVLIMTDPEDNKVYSDEYSVLFKNEKLFVADFLVVNNKVTVKITPTKDKIKFSIKTIETIKGE